MTSTGQALLDGQAYDFVKDILEHGRALETITPVPNDSGVVRRLLGQSES